MIRKLQKKTVWTIMTVLFLLIFLANLILHLTVLHVSCQMTTHVLQTLAENAETVWNTERFELAEDIPIGTLTIRGDELFNIFTTPLYAAELTDEGEVRFFGEFRNRSPLDSAALTDTLQTLARRKAGDGRVGNYLYYKLKIPGGSLTVLADFRQSFALNVVRRLTATSVLISIPILLVLFGVSVVLSRFALTPAVAAFHRQKQFISDAGHELKTPLSAIAVNAAVLESEIGPSKYMDCIQAEARRMDSLVRQMLEVACMEDGAPTTHRERFSLSEVVYQSTLPFESLAFEQGIHYDVQLQEDCVYTGDPELLRHVMSVLLDNAFKYTETGGQVSVRLRRESRRIVIEVYNTGQGISKEDLPHIFERFYRCDKARPGNGSYGLGLAIAQTAAEACGGTITAESEYGRWARFRVTL